MAEVNKSTNYGVLLEDAGADAAAKDLRKYQEMADKLIAAYPFVNRPMLIAQNIANAIVHHSINDQKNKLAGRYFADALGARAFHDAMDGNIVTPDSIQLRAALAAKAKAEAEKKAKAAVGNKNKSGKKSRMSDAEIDAFLNEELGGDTTGNGTYASAGVPKGGTKTIGYDPNPGNVSLAYAMRNAPEQERRDALINEWNRENGRLNRSSGTYASPGISNGGMYATGEGIKDANGNVLTNPGGDWEYQLALRDPQYGLGMMSKMSDAQKKYLQAVSDDMGYKYNFTGAPRYV